MIKKNRIPLIVGSEFSSLGRYSEAILAKSKISNFQIFRKLDEDKNQLLILLIVILNIVQLLWRVM